MANYIVSYHLHDVRHQQPVGELLQGWGAVRILDCLWVVTRNQAAGALRDALRAKAGPEDAVTVIELRQGLEWATVNAGSSSLDWLSKNLRSYP